MLNNPKGNKKIIDPMVSYWETFHGSHTAVIIGNTKANNENPAKMLCSAVSDLGLHGLLRYICLNTSGVESPIWQPSTDTQ